MSEAGSSNDRLKIFVSYSRREIATADKLVAALQVAGFHVTIDRRDLPYGEEWQKELADLFTSQNTSTGEGRTAIPATFLQVTVNV